ncbi:MAG: HAD-IIIA family hydrolase [Deltaproteobacteria bacterium]|nr:HAD-IIIA family hydrolase [Deltaproteobacteria bacterium]
MAFDEQLLENIRSLKLLILDVDGVLTDGKVILDDTGREIKHFDVRDGHGLKMLMRYGIEVVFLTGRRSSVVEYRACDLGVVEVYQGVKNKLEMYDEIVEKKNIAGAQAAYMGDDIIDIPFMRRVGFSIAVADAANEVKEIADYVTEKSGGRGAVREVCDLILKLQGKWEEVAEKYELP